MMRKFSTGMTPTLFISAITLMLFCRSATAANPSQVKISGLFKVFDSKTGAVDPYGVQEVAAFEMAISDINARKYPDLLPGITVKRAIRRLSGENIDAFDGAQEVNKWKSDGMIGSSTNQLSNALAQINNGYRQNQVAFGSTGSYLSYVGPYPYYFRVCSNDAFQGYALAEVLHNQFPQWKSLSVFSTTGNDLGYGSDLFQQFQLHASDFGLNIVSSHQFRSGLEDLTDYITKAKSTGTKIFVLLMQGPDAARLLYQGWKQGLFTEGIQIIGSNQVLGQECLQAFEKLDTEVSDSIADILRGTLVLRQTTLAAFPTDTYKAWVARWKSQTNTVPASSLDPKVPDYENTAACNITKDDTSLNSADFLDSLYKGKTRKSITDASIVVRCAGVLFNSFKNDGSDIAPLAPFVYDAVLSLAWGLHYAIFDGVIDPKDKVRKKKTGAYSVSGASTDFDYYGGDQLCIRMAEEGDTPFLVKGVTGDIHFRSGDSTGYGFGDREADTKFELLNFHPGTYCFKDKTGGLESLGVWEQEAGFKGCDVSQNPNCYYVYNTADGSIPIDRPRPVINALPASGSIILFLLAALSITIAAGFGAMIFRFRNKRLVKTYQPQMLYLTLFGFWCASIRIITAGYAFTDSVCNASVWFGHISFMIVFTTLTIKTWRVHIIVNSSFRRIKITTQMVVLATLAIVGLMCVYLIIVSAVGVPHLEYQIKDLGGLKSTWYPKCVDKVPEISIVLYVLEALWLAQGARLCWATKDAPDAVNDSGPIATAMYVIIFVAVVVFLLVFLIQLEPQTAELIIGLGFALATLSAECALFLPKAMLLYQGADLNTKMQIVLPDGRTLAEANAKVSDSTPDNSANDKPMYDHQVKLGKNKDQNVLVCKEQIMKWQRLMMSIESRQLIGTGSNQSSSHQSTHQPSVIVMHADEDADAMAADETQRLTGTKYSAAHEEA